jgi:hypothetical protein
MQLYPEMQDIDRQSTKTSFLQLFPSIWHIAAKTTSNETPRSKLRGISTKDISNNNAASSGVFTLRENKLLAATRSVRYSFITQRSVRYINFTVWRQYAYNRSSFDF